MVFSENPTLTLVDAASEGGGFVEKSSMIEEGRQIASRLKRGFVLRSSGYTEAPEGTAVEPLSFIEIAANMGHGSEVAFTLGGLCVIGTEKLKMLCEGLGEMVIGFRLETLCQE